MAKKGEGRWARLLEDEDVRRWHQNLARGAQSTADNYLRVLGRFLDRTGLTAAEVASMGQKRRDDLVADHVSALLDRGLAGSTVAVTKKAIVSWLEWNGKALKRRVKIPGVSRTPSLKDAHIPAQDELKRVLNLADGRARAATALMAFSGLRPEVMGSYMGDDGLRLRDFPELDLSGKDPAFTETPTLIEVPEDLSKTGHAYFTFLGHEGCEYLLAHLRERIEAGEDLGPESAVITPKKLDKPFMRTPNVSAIVRRPMRAAGLNVRPYIWRSYYASRCMLAEAKGFLRDYRVFFMGHSGDIQHVYALHKKLPPDTIEAMRQAYGAALEFLETQAPRRGEDPTQRLMTIMLKAAGWTGEELDGLDLAGMDEEELVDLLRRRAEASTVGEPNGATAQAAAPSPGGRQRIIPLNDLPTALTDGWMFRASLPDGRAVVEHDGPMFA